MKRRGGGIVKRGMKNGEVIKWHLILEIHPTRQQRDL